MDTTEKEIFKDIRGYEGRYQITNYGRVWSCIRNQFLNQSGGKTQRYLYVTLYHPNGKKNTERIHRLVALHFCDKSEDKTQVNHKDGNKLNNRADNLEWTTAKENVRHAHDLGIASNEGCVKSHLYKITVLKDNEVIGTFLGMKVAAEALGIHWTTVQRCVKLNKPTRYGYTFFVEKGGEANAIEDKN